MLTLAPKLPAQFNLPICYCNWVCSNWEAHLDRHIWHIFLSFSPFSGHFSASTLKFKMKADIWNDMSEPLNVWINYWFDACRHSEKGKALKVDDVRTQHGNRLKKTRPGACTMTHPIRHPLLLLMRSCMLGYIKGGAGHLGALWKIAKNENNMCGIIFCYKSFKKLLNFKWF